MKSLPKKMLLLIVSMLLFLSSTFIQATAGEEDGKIPACCQDISTQELASILQISPDDIIIKGYYEPVSPEDKKNKLYKVPPCRCRLSSRSSFLKAASYVVYVFNDPVQAKQSFLEMKENFSTAAEVKDLSGIGVQAFWVDDDRFCRSLAYKGNVMVDVMSPRKEKLQKRVLSIVLEKEIN